MNIILNSYCNLKCNYCFADEYMEETVKNPDKSMDIDFKGDCFNCFPFHNLKLGNVRDFKEVNSIAVARMRSKFLTEVFEDTQAKEPCRSWPHYRVRCSSGCFSYNFV